MFKMNTKILGIVTSVVVLIVVGVVLIIGHTKRPEEKPAVTTPTQEEVTSEEEVKTTPEEVYKGPKEEVTKEVALSGHIFFDYNGNGRQDERESPVTNVILSMGKESTTTNESGFYRIDDLQTGEYHLSISPPSNFKYMSKSSNDFSEVIDGYDIPLHNSTTINIGLMEGFLTLPSQTQVPQIEEWRNWAKTLGYTPYSVGYVDLDYRLGTKRNYLGNSENMSDQHQGIDYYAPIGTPIVAAAPGKVWLVVNEPTITNIHILHETAERKFITLYGHISKNFLVKEGDFVRRGQLIAEVGEEGTPPHLHFAVWEVPASLTTSFEIRDYIYDSIKGGYPAVTYPVGESVQEVPAVVDPYRDVTNESSRSLWTKDNSPQYP